MPTGVGIYFAFCPQFRSRSGESFSRKSGERAIILLVEIVEQAVGGANVIVVRGRERLGRGLFSSD